MLDAIESAPFIQKDTFLYSRRLDGSSVLPDYTQYAFVFLFVQNKAQYAPPPPKLVAACATYSLKLCGILYVHCAHVRLLVIR
jgi:hypothetical protein